MSDAEQERPSIDDPFRVIVDPPDYLVGYGSDNMFTVVCRASSRKRAEQIARLLNEDMHR